jgi:ketosteroid isomerase-like protein
VKRPVLLTAAVLALSLAAASAHTAATDAGPARIVAAERAFAARVRALGVRDGFLEWLAPTAVVFRPGPVNARTSYLKQPVGWHGLLAWSPAFAAISADGQMGWSTGPWTWRTDSTAKKLDASGEYMSVWRRQADGTWRAVLDCGIASPASSRGLDSVRTLVPQAAGRLGARPLAARQSLYQADASFARTCATDGVAAAVARTGADDLIVLREGRSRIVGRDAARDSIAAHETVAKLMSNAQYVSDAGDMGYTYGSFVTGTLAEPDSAWYVHVWHRGPAATWRLAFQVVMPVPARRGR